MIEQARYPFVLATDRLPLSQHDVVSRNGLARAHGSLMQAVAARGGAWVAASTGATKASLWLNPLYPRPDVLAAHRDGYCAKTLASVYFGLDVSTPPQHADWAAAHHSVNQQYARHIAELATPGAVVWIHDHPLQLLPGMLRDLRPDLRIGYSSHSPFPATGALLTVAEHDQILSSLLAADLVSFPDLRSAANLTGYTHTTGHPPTPSLIMPIPVDTHAIAELAANGTVQAQAARIRHRLRPATTIMLAIGGNDPGDGNLILLQEYQQLLASGKLDPQSTVLIHLTIPGSPAEDSQDRQDTERLIAQINGTHAALRHLPVQHERGPFTPAELAAFYLAADIMVAVPTRDRTTHEAVEYVAARSDGTGRLVLSEFSTAGSQLPAATPINPHAPGALTEAICRAASYAKTRSANMIAMRRQALTGSVHDWADTFLYALTHDASGAPAPIDNLPLQQANVRGGKPNGNAHHRLATTGSHS